MYHSRFQLLAFADGFVLLAFPISGFPAFFYESDVHPVISGEGL